MQTYRLQTMSIMDIIEQVSKICKKYGVTRLDLFGSFAMGTQTPRSDIDFVIYGNVDQEKIEWEIEQIDTLRKIDLFYFDEIKNEYLLEDIKKYGKQIL